MSENPLTIFQGELERREQEIVNTLPSTIKPEQFLNAAIIAVKQNTELLTVDRRSLHKAVTQAARDGMMPDGKEGVILIQKERVKVKRNGRDEYEWTLGARWQPMTFGIRKRALEIAGIIIDTDVVHENDFFECEGGDNARIVHKRPKLGTPRGPKIGAYAIFRRGSEILHREVMDAEQIAVVKECSKQPNGMLWTKFEEEAWRKSVLRRGIKSVPTAVELRQIFDRDDEANFSFAHMGPTRIAPPPIPSPPAIPSAPIEEVEMDGRPFEDPSEANAPPLQPEPEMEVEIPELSTIKALFGSARSRKSVAAMEQRMRAGIMLMDEDTRAAAVEIIQAAKGRVGA